MVFLMFARVLIKKKRFGCYGYLLFEGHHWIWLAQQAIRQTKEMFYWSSLNIRGGSFRCHCIVHYNILVVTVIVEASLKLNARGAPKKQRRACLFLLAAHHRGTSLCKCYYCQSRQTRLDDVTKDTSTNPSWQQQTLLIFHSSRWLFISDIACFFCFFFKWAQVMEFYRTAGVSPDHVTCDLL